MFALRNLRNNTFYQSIKNNLNSNYFSSLDMISEKIQQAQDKQNKTLGTLDFANTAFKALRIDENEENKTREVRGCNYSKVKPTPLDNPKIISLSKPGLELLDLDYEQVLKDPKAALYLVGNELMPGSEPIAHNYCGHQFGNFAGQLGDGRAITLGDIKNQKGEVWELQLKGSGLTPYSRTADGKAVLRSSIREYLCSEAMQALGIPTTRAASLIVTDSLAERDPKYNGNVIMEKCAVVMRLSPSFWRFGSFEIFKEGNQYGRRGPSQGLENEMLPEMLGYLLNTHYPEIVEKFKEPEQQYEELFREVTRRTAYMVSLWQCYGFCHGVMNTDNMSMLGVTIDYGPFGWMDYMNQNHICNTSDEGGRYAYKNQPLMCKWNLMKLATALIPVLDNKKSGPILDGGFDEYYNEYYYSKMYEKLGLIAVRDDKDQALVDQLFEVMDSNASDFTNTFRELINIQIPESSKGIMVGEETLEIYDKLSPSTEQVLNRYKPKFTEEQIKKLKGMQETNPQMLYMMGVSPDVLIKEEEKLEQYKTFMTKDLSALRIEMQEKWMGWLIKYQRRLHLETESIQSTGKDNIKILNKFESLQQLRDARKQKMESVNPIYVLRNYMAEEAIQKAEKGDYSGVNNLLKMLLNPFTPSEEIEESKTYKKCPPSWSNEICVSCSS